MESPRAQIRKVFDKWLTLPDKTILDVVCGSILATRMPGVPIFLAIVGPPGSGKSVVIEACSKLHDAYPLSKLTPKTFLSGSKEKESSLLAELGTEKPRIILFKDFTTVLSMPATDRDMIMSDLREIYDGTYAGRWGTGKREPWEGKLGLVAGCTGAWDQIAERLSTLGERFIIYRMPSGNPLAIAERALRSAPQELQMEEELKQCLLSLDTISTGTPTDLPSIGYDARQHLAELCRFTAHLRTQVPRHYYTREVVALPELEGTGRLAKQFGQLIRGICLFKGHDEAYTDDIALVERVALGSLPPARRLVLETLPLSGASVRDLERQTGVPRSVLGRTLQDLQLLGVLKSTSNGFIPVDEFKVFFVAARTPPGAYEDEDDDNGHDEEQDSP